MIIFLIFFDRAGNLLAIILNIKLIKYLLNIISIIVNMKNILFNTNRIKLIFFK